MVFSISLEKLSHVPGRGKIVQTHRALDDREVKGLIKEGFFPNRGYKVKVLAASQEGLHNLYRLITLSHTERLFKKPSVFRSDLVKYRQGLLIGAAGGREGETFSLFSSFNFEKRKQEKLRFYDYIEVNSPATFRYLWLNGQIGEAELKNMTKKIIVAAEELKIPAVASHHVYYCENKERLLKEIIVANEGMNGSRHYLYNQATLSDKEDPNKVVGVSVKQPPLNYSATKSSGTYKVVQKTHQDGSLVGSRGSIGSSFIAYLCGITDLNPLPFYKFCQKCRYVERYETQDRVYSGYDYREKEKCPTCSSLLTMEEGEKTPDIDLNFSGEYQKIAHNYVRQLLGEDSVYRIGTINTLSQQTAEIF
ncbi:6720_t:CDS:2 [Entrophospora sp. SA101]|nr:6720_t:CDS:2 [Entrophospora sp. SA101]